MMIAAVHRFFISLITLLSVLLITFFLLHTVPGGPFDQERQLPPEIEKNLHEKYGLEKKGNQNLFVWFLKDCKSYGKYLLKGKLGPSLKFRDRDVSEIVLSAAIPSLELGGYALVTALLTGLGGAIILVLKKRGLAEQLAGFLSALFAALPGFVSAVFLVFVFSLTFHFFPPALWEGASSRVLPVITLSLAPLALLLQLSRQGMEDELKKDYVRTARAKGVSDRIVLLRHVLRNAVNPILSVIGPLTATLVTGSFVVESVFSIPGLGKHFVTAVVDRDYFLVMGITLFYSVILIGLNWLTDMGYGLLDPRMRK